MQTFRRFFRLPSFRHFLLTALSGIVFAGTAAEAAEPRKARTVLDEARTPAQTVLDYLGVDLSKGGVRSDLTDLVPYPRMKIGSEALRCRLR